GAEAGAVGSGYAEELVKLLRGIPHTTSTKRNPDPNCGETNTHLFCPFLPFRALGELAHVLQQTTKLNNYSYGKYLVYRSCRPRDCMAHWFSGLLGWRVDSHPACTGGNSGIGKHHSR